MRINPDAFPKETRVARDSTVDTTVDTTVENMDAKGESKNSIMGHGISTRAGPKVPIERVRKYLSAGPKVPIGVPRKYLLRKY